MEDEVGGVGPRSLDMEYGGVSWGEGREVEVVCVIEW